MATRLIGRSGGGPVPYSYTLAGFEQLSPQAIFAGFGGDTLADAFIPCVSYYAQDGTLIGRYPAPVIVSGENFVNVSWGVGVQPLRDPPGVAAWGDSLADHSSIAVGANYGVQFGPGNPSVEIPEWSAVAIAVAAFIGDVTCDVTWHLHTGTAAPVTTSAQFTQVVGNAKVHVLAAHGAELQSVTFAEAVPASGARAAFDICGTIQTPGVYGV